MTIKRVVLTLLAGTGLCAAADTAVDILRRSMEKDTRNLDLAKDYTYREKIVTRTVDGSGKPTKTESQTRDVVMLYGRPFARLLEKDGKPLSAGEKTKEDERFNKVVERRRQATAEENTKARREYQKRRESEARFRREIPDAFNFKLLPEEKLDGRPVYVIEGEPKPGYRPREPNAKFLAKVRGKLWIDKADYNWVKVEAQTTDTISLGLFLARIGPGTWLTFEQRRVNGELWLPAKAGLKIDARVVLFAHLRREQTIDYYDYRKFQTDTKITIADEKENR